MKTNKGFTLIELLVVIAIIGILTTIILISLNTSRDKSYDAKTKVELASLRSQAEIYHSIQNPNSYGAVTNLCSAGMFADANIAKLLNALPTSVTPNCRSTGSAYAVSVPLLYVVGSANNWCVDSAGRAMAISSALASGDVICN